MKTASINEIAEALGVSKRGANKKAVKEGWRYTKKAIKGGYKKRFPLIHLPEDIRIKLARYKASSILTDNSPAALAGAAAGAELAQARKEEDEKARIKTETMLAAFGTIPPEKQAVAYARKDVLQARDNYLVASAIGNVKKGTSQFCHLYNGGEIRIGDHIRIHVEKVSWSTLCRWQSIIKKEGITGLVPGYHNPNKGSTQLRVNQTEFIIGMIKKHPHAKFSTLQMALEARFSHLPGMNSIRRFVNSWKKENGSLLLYVTNPDKWRNKHQFAIGDASEQVVRLNQVWEFDSTPADIMLVDGRYCLIGVIDVYSRRLKLLVSKTSKSTAVAALTRRALVDWGMPEIAKTDNGADYVSHHMIQIFESLQIEQTLCPPFTPEAKPHIERSFKTFAHSFQELMPGYIGHSVADRKDIEARRSFASRITDRDDAIELLMTSEELQKYCDRWCSAIYHQNGHRSLNNRTPLEVARAWKETVRAISNERALDILLAEAPSNKGLRTVTKKGVSVDNITYISDSLPEVGIEVRVKIDATDLGTIYLFDTSGIFLCVAQDPLRTGIDRAETAAKLRNRQKQLVREGKKELNRIAREQALDEIHEEILSHREAQSANIIELPVKREAYTNPALEEAAKAAEALDMISNESSSFDELILHLDEESAIASHPGREEKIVVLRSDSDQYDLLRTQIKSENRKLTSSEYEWLTRYYETATGRSYMALEGDFRETIGLAGNKQAEI